jgi:uncharacterized protein
MKCPSCSDVTLLISSRENIEIDYCPECRGVWLDRGELDKIIERSDGERSRTKAEHGRGFDRDDDRDDDDRRPGRFDKRRKRRGFLSEMFEFGD